MGLEDIQDMQYWLDLKILSLIKSQILQNPDIHKKKKSPQQCKIDAFNVHTASIRSNAQAIKQLTNYSFNVMK